MNSTYSAHTMPSSVKITTSKIPSPFMSPDMGFCEAIKSVNKIDKIELLAYVERCASDCVFPNFGSFVVEQYDITFIIYD